MTPCYRGYHTIYADPPWPEYGGGKIRRGADRHYQLMTVDEIIALKEMVEELVADNCHLYLWATNNYLPAAFQVMRAWGFTYKTLITWAKDRFGLGQYFRGQTEHCLFGIKGVLSYKVLNEKRAQGTTLIQAPRGEHSRKPEAMRQMIEKVSYPPYIELFARPHDGGLFQSQDWDFWGEEMETTEP